MRTGSLFRRGADAAAEAAHDRDDDASGDRAVLSLIGTPLFADETKADGCASGAVDLMASLYGQYRRALDDPYASLTDDWGVQSMPVAMTDARDAAHESGASFESIETFVTGVSRMEHAFGLLRAGDAPAMTDVDPVPEILRLFAPIEYRVAAQRKPSALPPLLTRREHHAPGIDSPLFAAGSTSSTKTTTDDAPLAGDTHVET